MTGPNGGSATMIALGSKQSFKGFSSPYVSIDEYAADSEKGLKDAVVGAVTAYGIGQVASVAKVLSGDSVSKAGIATKEKLGLGAQKAQVTTSGIRAETIKVVNPELVPISIKPL